MGDEILITVAPRQTPAVWFAIAGIAVRLDDGSGLPELDHREVAIAKALLQHSLKQLELAVGADS